MADIWRNAGLRVIELGSGISAAYGARLLSDFGADVIKVERPGSGDETRLAGPFPDDEPHPEKSGLFLYLNYNKRGVTLDITEARGIRVLAHLLATADVLIENLGAGGLAALSLPEGALHQRLIVCSISPYGQDGPKAHYQGSEISAYASGGLMYITGEAERAPLKHGLHQAAHLSGVNAASAILVAAIRQRRQGLGDRIDISMQETSAITAFPALANYTHTGGVMIRGRGQVPRFISSMPMETSDGWVLPSYAGIGTWWDSFPGFIEVPELGEEGFLTQAERRENGALLDEKVGPKFKERTKAELFHGGQAWGLTFTALQTAEEVVNSDQLRERDFFVEQDHPVAGRVRMAGMIPAASNTSRAIRSPAPLLGQHNAEVFGALELSAEDLRELMGVTAV